MTNTTLLLKIVFFVILFNSMYLVLCTQYTDAQSHIEDTYTTTDTYSAINEKSNMLFDTAGETRDQSANQKLTDQTYGNAYTVTENVWGVLSNLRLSKLFGVTTSTKVEDTIVGVFDGFIGIFDIAAVIVFIMAVKKS